MIASLPLAVALTVAFVLTGGYSLLRWSATLTGSLPPERRTAELAHLLMSVAMVAMTWTVTGSLGTGAQAVLFTVFTGYFAIRALSRRADIRHTCSGGTAHALMSAAMVWMLLSMPWLMPSHSAGDMAGMSGMDMAGMDMSGAAPAGWATGVTVVACALLLATCGYWLGRLLRPGPAPVLPTPAPALAALIPEKDPTPEKAAAPGGAVAPGGGVAPEESGGAVVTEEAGREDAPGCATAPDTAGTACGPRSDAACHTVMSLGMVTMLAAMLLGG